MIPLILRRGRLKIHKSRHPELVQDPNVLYIRSRNKFGMTRFASFLTFETASLFLCN
jgi:hypothetical protein